MHDEGVRSGRQRTNCAVCRKRVPSMWSYRTSSTRSGRSGTNDRSLPTFHRLYSELRGVRVPGSCFAQFHGCPSKLVTSGCSSPNSSRRRAMGKAPTTPMLASLP